MTAATTLPDDLSDRQREVLTLLGEGKTPTEIGEQLNITSQGVHGHMQRLRKRGLIPGEPAAAPKIMRAKSAKRSNGRPVTPADAFAEIRASIREQHDALDGRITELDNEILRLQDDIKSRRDEKKQIEKATKELADFEATLPAVPA